MNCWEWKKCGREENGLNVSEFGICPAYVKSAGRTCWRAVGTFCKSKVKDSLAQKVRNCMACDFYVKMRPI